MYFLREKNAKILEANVKRIKIVAQVCAIEE